MWDYGPDNRGPEMAIVSIVMTVICVIAVALRSYTMAKLLKRFLFEDLLAVVTCLLQCAFCTIVVAGVSYGLGAHVEHVPEVNRPKALVFKWAGQVAYIVVSTLVKFVVGIFLLRLCVNNNWQRLTIIVLLIVVGVFNAFYVFVAIFQCQPIEFYWYRYEPNAPVTGKCNGKALATIPTYFAVLIGIVSDLVLALLPATLIKGANLDKRTKISVCCVLALGSLASVATIARIPYAKQLLSNPDYLFNFSDLAMWSIVECGIAITASSLATLRPLFVKMRFFASSHFTTRFNYGSGMASGGLPIQSARTGTVTVISSRHAKRNTAMTGTTAMTGSTAVGTPGLTSVKEYQDGIQVEKEFEMSIMTRENSQDSIDRLEAEINEVIRPGLGKRKASQDRFSSALRSNSLTPRPRPAPLQTSFGDTAVLSPKTASTPTISTGSSTNSAGPRFPFASNSNTPTSSSPQRQIRLSNGHVRGSNSFSQPQSPRTPASAYSAAGFAHTDTALRCPPPMPPAPAPAAMQAGHHQHSYSADSVHTQAQAPGGATFSPPNFHLPTTRMHGHQSVMSTQSFMSTATSHHSRRTFGDRQSSSKGLGALPRLAQNTVGDFVPSHMMTINTNINSNAVASPLGSPVNLVTARLPNRTTNAAAGGSDSNSPTNASPVSGVRFPFQRGDATASPRLTNNNNNNNNNTNTTPPTSSFSARKQQAKRGEPQRVSAFLADDSPGSAEEDQETAAQGYREQHARDNVLLEEETDESPPWTQRPQEEAPSPLRSHPPLKGSWV